MRWWEVLLLPTWKASTLKHKLKQFVRNVLTTEDTIEVILMKGTSHIKILVHSGYWYKNHTLSNMYVSCPRWIQKKWKHSIKSSINKVNNQNYFFGSKGNFAMRYQVRFWFLRCAFTHLYSVTSLICNSVWELLTCKEMPFYVMFSNNGVPTGFILIHRKVHRNCLLQASRVQRRFKVFTPSYETCLFPDYLIRYSFICCLLQGEFNFH